MIDWNALGTWAAVVAALGISLRETWYRHRDRSARHLIVTAELHPAVQSLHLSLREIVYDCRNFEKWSNAEMLASGNEAFESALRHLSLEPWRSLVAQPDALPEHMLFPLYKSMTQLRMLERVAAARKELRSEHSLNTQIEQTFLEDWMKQGTEVCESLGWFLHHADKLLATKRWKHPEAALGYVVHERVGS